jgi:excisionase family DNA binding protein
MFLSVKELANELGMSVDSIYRAYRKGEIPAAQICRTLRFDLRKVRRAMEQKAKAMPNSRCATRATGGESRRRATPTRPRLGKTGAFIARKS